MTDRKKRTTKEILDQRSSYKKFRPKPQQKKKQKSKKCTFVKEDGKRCGERCLMDFRFCNFHLAVTRKGMADRKYLEPLGREDAVRRRRGEGE